MGAAGARAQAKKRVEEKKKGLDTPNLTQEKVGEIDRRHDSFYSNVSPLLTQSEAELE